MGSDMLRIHAGSGNEEPLSTESGVTCWDHAETFSSDRKASAAKAAWPPRARVMAGSECCLRLGPLQPGWLSPTMCRNVFLTTSGDVVASFKGQESAPQEAD